MGGRWAGDGREMAGRWPGDGREPGKEWLEYGNHARAGGRRRIRSIKCLMTF